MKLVDIFTNDVEVKQKTIRKRIGHFRERRLLKFFRGDFVAPQAMKHEARLFFLSLSLSLSLCGNKRSGPIKVTFP